jgi:arylsulfatase A-like enzyme
LPNGRRNTAQSRAVRYPLYLEQVICTHRKLNELFEEMMRHGVYEDAIIIIQGDHGSRIDTGPPRPGVLNLSERDFIDGFSTLYAIKLPGLNPGYDRRALPIDELFTRHIRDGKLPPGADWAPPPLVYLARPDTPVHRRRLDPEDLIMVKHRLPPFANGEVGAGAQR